MATALINDPDILRAIVKTTVQRVLEWEMTEHLQAGPHEPLHTSGALVHGSVSSRVVGEVPLLLGH